MKNFLKRLEQRLADFGSLICHATNRVYAQSNQDMPQGVWLAFNSTVPKSGYPCLLGKIPGVAVEDFDANGIGVAQKDGIFTLSVKAEGGAMVVGAKVYFDTTEAALATCLNDDNSGVLFGYILTAIASGATAKVQVQVGASS